MSFRGDDQRRYGQVPPVQYPVANRPNDQAAAYSTRRRSFDQGDDAALLGQAPSHGFNGPTGGDELFLGSSTGAAPPPPSNYHSTYQNQYEQPYSQPPPPSTYNPQHFGRSPSASLPYHPGPPSQYQVSTTAPPAPQAPGPGASYTPAAYNPAAYASTAAPQRTPTYQGYTNYTPQYGNSQPTAGYGSPSSVYPPAPPHSGQASVPPASQYDPGLPSPPPHSATSSHGAGYDPSIYSTTSYTGSQYSTFSNGNSPSITSYSASSTATTPYPAYSQMPAGPQYNVNDPTSFQNRSSRSNSQASRLSSSSTHGVQTSTSLRHPRDAPLPGRPIHQTQGDELHWAPNGSIQEEDFSQEHLDQDTIIQDIEAELGGAGRRDRPSPLGGARVSDDDIRNYRASDASTPRSDTATTPSAVRYDHRYPHHLGNESDPEGMAGALAMRQAEMDDQRFSGNPYPQSDVMPVPNLAHLEEEESSGSDFGGMDLGLFSGGYAGNLTYGTDVGFPPVPGSTQEESRPLPPTPSYPQYPTSDTAPANDSKQPTAEMDYPGAGGLLQPGSAYPTASYRSSFDDGEEQGSLYSRQSGSESPYKEDEYPDIFYHPGPTNRPLPSLPMLDTKSPMVTMPVGQGQYQHGYSLSSESRPAYPSDRLDVHYSPGSSHSQVERSISLISHSTTPTVQAPTRSRTDAAEERKRLYRQSAQHSAQDSDRYEYDAGPPASVAYDMITLPTGRKRKFVPAKLTSQDIRRCSEPWALSSIARWVREMADGEPDLKQKTIEEGLVRLFTAKVPTMNVADAETLSVRVVDIMLQSGILVPEEEWVKFGPGAISGVLWQLTGSGCYAPKLHEVEAYGRCYSHHCTRTLKKANIDDLLSEDSVKQEDWATFFKLTKESIQGKHKKEIEKQNVLHEIVTSEEGYMGQLEVLRVLYRDQLRTRQPPIIAPQNMERFLEKVFGKVDAVQATNKNHLLAQLKYRQQEQGPWITGFSDLFREWIRKARTAYVEYASAYPLALFLMKREAERNLHFRQFLDQVRSHKRSERLDWTHFLKTPITRLQRYSFLLDTVEKNMLGESEEKTNLAKAIEEIRTVTLECDQRVAEMQRQAEMMELNAMLVLRPGFQAMLNLDHLGRKLLFQGDVQRIGSKGMRWVESHALLFDHYLIIAKTVNKGGGAGRKFDVSKEPIPMPLLFLDSFTEDAVTKQKGLTTPLGRTTTSVSDSKLSRITTNGSDRPGLEHVNSGSSVVSAPRLGPAMATDNEGKVMYPFRVKHLGHEIYTLYAATPQARQEWCSKIIEAKTLHAQALALQNAEPFKLRVLADSAFAYDSVSAIGKQPSVKIEGTPLDRSIRDLEAVYGPGRGPAPVCRAQVNCATGFSAYGKSIIAIGTDYGVYISDASDPRGWQKTEPKTQKVTQIAVLEEFQVCLMIVDRSLISYPLDVVAPVSNFPAPAHDNSRRAPQRLAKDVSFFAAARMKDRMLVFYKKKEGVHNTFFKVLEPVFHRAAEKKSKWLSSSKKTSGVTETFRDYDEFFFPTECYSLNLFHSYIAVSTAKGFELLTLDKKQPMSIPDVKHAAIANIASRIRDQRPLGMFRLNDQEFLLTYEDCAVYVDKHGDVSRTLIMEYSGKQKKAKGATLCGQYLILFNDDYVEVRNAENGRLRQIIAGRDVRCLDYGTRGPTGTTAVEGGLAAPIQNASGQVDSRATVKIGMTHPEIPGMQVVLEMLLNDGHREK
ncbi:related to GDP/GTP exchange factor Rom2p [Cephalotrichum gorgonifer]|uniref:Related to GDP/GTP exchange factor Rom2p n=1 Tax=Cephalotrichum gorgonifer TaxID=2041049 RepID=A0AAE8MUU9_9PEZI|nr:related to GDP/GTP exchange factor Rom2p [Cephalotrichum gorgonifer]